jgi:hypothetical protein
MAVDWRKERRIERKKERKMSARWNDRESGE